MKSLQGNRRGILIGMMICLSIIMLSFASAETYKMGNAVKLKVSCDYIDCSNAVTITVSAPNSSILVNNQTMAFANGYQIYTVANTTSLGEYKYFLFSDSALGTDGYYANSFDTTLNGNQLPDGFTIAIFSIIFLAILGSLIYLSVNALGHLLTLDFDVNDLAWNLGALFVLYGFDGLAIYYLGSLFVNNMMDTILNIAIYTNGLIPFIAFALSLSLGAMVRQKLHQNKTGERHE